METDFKSMDTSRFEVAEVIYVAELNGAIKLIKRREIQSQEEGTWVSRAGLKGVDGEIIPFINDFKLKL